jgi:hypothetical protein
MNYGAKSAFSNECEGERESVREMVICLYIFLSFIELQLKYEKGLEW